ncbi:hypothetical protein PQI66_09740 [Corynebacterium sp. USCH3]|uniref:hypothetical protein n=1 Tax=Corynebacterium sp. USCH3 TaxID=3024840 RepID=UPI0030A181FA
MLYSEHDPLRTFDTLEDVVTECVIPALRDEGLDPSDYDPVGIALSVSEKVDGQWVAQTIRLRDAKWWHLLPEDPVKRLVEHARIADQAVRRAKAAGDTEEMHAMEDRRNRAASAAFAAGASIEVIAKRIHRESYRVADWIKAANDGRLPDRE